MNRGNVMTDATSAGGLHDAGALVPLFCSQAGLEWPVAVVGTCDAVWLWRFGLGVS